MDDARTTVRRTLAQVKTFLAQEAPPRLSEADTKVHFIEPLVAALGWSGIGVVTREYYVKNSQEFIDYVMAGPDGRRLLAIEAKPLQTAPTEKHAAQLIQYCAVEGVEWAALTNGRELQFFNTFLKPDLAAKRVLSLDLLAFNSDPEFDALFGQVWQLSRESMTTPTGARTWLLQRRLDAAVRDVLGNPASPTIRQLRRARAEVEVPASAQDLVQWFRAHLAAPLTVLPPPAATDLAPRPAQDRSASALPAEHRPAARPARALADGPRHILTPIADDEHGSGREALERLLGAGWYVFGEKTPTRTRLAPGDRLCFYETGKGVVAEAEVASAPERRTLPHVRHAERFPWAFRVTGVRLFFDDPVLIDAALRARLDAFRGRDPARGWAWFVQQTHAVTEQDFGLLTGKAASTEPDEAPTSA